MKTEISPEDIVDQRLEAFFEKEEKRRRKYYDSLPKWLSNREKFNSLRMLDILSEQFNMNEIKGFINSYPEMTIPGCVGDTDGLGTDGFIYFIGELWLLNVAIQAGESEGQKILSGKHEYYLWRQTKGGWTVGNIHNPCFIKTRQQGFKYIKTLIENPYNFFRPLEFYQIINGAETTEESDTEAMNTGLTIKHGSGHIKPTDEEKKAIKEYQSLAKEIAEQSSDPITDPDTKEALIEELNQINKAISGIKNPITRGSSLRDESMERARVNIANIIKNSLKSVKMESPELADFLEKRITRGNSFYYTPNPDDPRWLTS